MGNNYDVKSFSFIAVIVVVVAGIALGYFVYSTLMSTPTTSTTDTKITQLKTDQYESLTAVKDYGQKVTSTEPGYGRTNPFAPAQ